MKDKTKKKYESKRARPANGCVCVCVCVCVNGRKRSTLQRGMSSKTRARSWGGGGLRSHCRLYFDRAKTGPILSKRICMNSQTRPVSRVNYTHTHTSLPASHPHYFRFALLIFLFFFFLHSALTVVEGRSSTHSMFKAVAIPCKDAHE